MSAPVFFARDGEVFYRSGLWLPRPQAERILADFKRMAGDPGDYFRVGAAELAAELSAALGDPACHLCGDDMEPQDMSAAVRDASGLDICPACLEHMADETTQHARSEVGLVGSGGVR